MVPSDARDPAKIDPASISTIGDLRRLLYDSGERALAMRVVRPSNGEHHDVLCDDLLLSCRWLPDSFSLRLAITAYLETDAEQAAVAYEALGLRSRDEVN